MAVWPYSTSRWARLRRWQLFRAPCCALCYPRLELATDVDHIIPIRDGGEPFEAANLRSLCHSCHSRVTHAWQHGRDVRVKGCDANGMPLDPAHPWNASEKLLGAEATDRGRTSEGS